MRKSNVWMVVAAGLLVAGCQSSGGASGQQGRQTRVVTVEKPFELTHTDGDPYQKCRSDREERVVKAANASREQKGLHPLHCAPKLRRVAVRHARDMCRKDYASHVGKDGRNPADRAEDAGIDYMAVGENIAVGQTSVQQVHDGWMGSPQHRANILHDKFSRLGVGYVDCGGRPRWVQVFAN